MFDFVSPFDHLSSSTGSIKKKPVPVQPPTISGANEDASSWTAVPDPKRQSVDNLLEHLARGQPPPSQPPPSAYETFLSSGEFSHGEKMQSRAPPPPLPPKPIPNRTASPRASPPKPPAQRPQFRPTDSPATQHVVLPLSQAGTRRDKESSPGPRGFRSKAPPIPSKFSKNQSSPRYCRRCVFAISD